jgi:hypothetical protein
MIKKQFALLGIVLTLLAVDAAQAKVVDTAAGGFTIKHTVEFAASPSEA